MLVLGTARTSRPQTSGVIQIPMDDFKKLAKLKRSIKELYWDNASLVPYHGWPHIVFVSIKAIEFAKTINANVFLVESAALLHDLNYIIKPNSKPGLAENLRITYLNKSKYNLEDIDLIVKEKGTGK